MSKISSRPGMGAIPYKDGNKLGTTFRVWAKFATEVNVGGSFNNWSEVEHPLYSEGDGFWSVDVPQAAINDTYRFFIKSPFIETPQWRTDPYCKNVNDDTATDNGVIVSSDFDWGTNVFQMPNWNELVIYELHVASFNRSNEEPGNFSSMIEKLDYLKELGINAVQIMPIFGFPGKFSLGYNPALPFDIESNYGTARDFKRFVKNAHERGIAVILDVVYNHFGPDDLSSALWRFDGWHENEKGGIYFYNDRNSFTYFGAANRPDYGRGEVRQFIRDNVMMWLDEYRIDGLRFDSTVNMRNIYGRNNDPENEIPAGWSLMQWINNEIDQRTPWKLTIAEDLQNNEYITKNTQDGGAGFDSQWDSYFYNKFIGNITASNDSDRNMCDVRDAILFRFEADAVKRQIYINNHDECAQINNKVRLPDKIWVGHADHWFTRKRYCLAASILFTTPGIPLIFMGDEFLEWGSWSDTGSLDWNKRNQFSGIWTLYQSLIQLRRNLFNTTRGLTGQHANVFHINNNDKVIAYHRWENGGMGDDVVVVANFANTSYDSYSIGFPQEGTWHVRFNSDWNGYSGDFGNHPGYDVTVNNNGLGEDGMPYSGKVGLGPYSVLILSR